MASKAAVGSRSSVVGQNRKAVVGRRPDKTQGDQGNHCKAAIGPRLSALGQTEPEGDQDHHCNAIGFRPERLCLLALLPTGH